MHLNLLLQLVPSVGTIYAVFALDSPQWRNLFHIEWTGFSTEAYRSKVVCSSLYDYLLFSLSLYKKKCFFPPNSWCCNLEPEPPRGINKVSIYSSVSAM